MYLKHEELVIREANYLDAILLCKWWNDGKVMEHAGFPNGLGISEEKIINQLKNDSVDNRRLILECCDKSIGEMSYKKVSDGVVEIGMKICEFTAQEKGYGTRFLKMLIDYLFEKINFSKIILDTNLTNLRAQHVYEKIGFKKIRVNYDSWNDQLGNLQSSVYYELTIQDYKSSSKQV